MPRIIRAIMTVQTTATSKNPGLAVPVANSAMAMTTIGRQQASIIQWCDLDWLSRGGC
jgi:hypothetical protein